MTPGTREYRLVVNGCLRYRNVNMAKVRAYRDRMIRAFGVASAPLPALRIYSVRRSPAMDSGR